MFEKLSTILISGRCYPLQTELEVFAKKTGNKARSRVSLIFGKNGSGKTTLSNALRMESLGRRLTGITNLKLFDGDGNPISNTSDAFTRVKVFNESFVDEKLRVEGDGVGSIVMLGETGDIKTEIEKNETILMELREERSALEDQYAQFQNMDNVLSPDYLKTKLLDKLKGNMRWASRKKLIDNGARNSRVDDSVFNRIADLTKPDSDLVTLTSKFQSELSVYQSIEYGGADKLPDCPDIPDWMRHLEEDRILSLLRESIEMPELTNRDRRILSIVQDKGLVFVQDAQKYLAGNRPPLCPYCLRPITSQEITKIGEEVSAAIAADANIHLAELNNALPNREQDLDLSAYENQIPHETLSCKAAFEKCLKIIAQYEALIEQKKNHPFVPIDVDPLGLSIAMVDLSDSHKVLKEAITNRNKTVDRAGKQKKSLYTLNDEMARLEIDQLLIAYKKSINDKKLCNANLTKAKEAEAKTVNDLSSLHAKLNNTYIALSKLNTMLAVVFGDRNRLKLEPIAGNEKAYRLVSRGVRVKPEDVSSGERNAIALCYFFTELGEGRQEGKEYDEEMLLIVDDPVSSFDFENKIGILTLVKKYVRLVLQGNKNSRAILMTHDYLTMKSLESACKDINKELDNVRGQKPKELNNYSIIDRDESDSSYDTLLNRAYKHILNPSDGTRRSLGNAARRLMEAFSTFEYNCSFDSLILQEKNRNLISDPFLREYFRDFQFKLALHQESHLKDSVNGEGSIETNDLFSNEGIDRSIREALCLIFLLNEEHLLSHVSDPGAKEQFEGWINEIKELDSDSQK